VKFDGVMNNSLMNAWIGGSDFKEDFYLMQFHFHWGINNAIGKLI